jgi:hypothetical protein
VTGEERIPIPYPTFAFVGGLPCTALDFSCAFCNVIVITFNTLTLTFNVVADELKMHVNVSKNVRTLP